MEINKLSSKSIPQKLQTLHDAPNTLFSSLPSTKLELLLQRKCVAVVGSRKLTPYGRQVTTELAGTNDGEALQQASKLDIASFNQTLTMLEISGKIRSLGANQWALS